jgi:hypothetical protein
MSATGGPYLLRGRAMSSLLPCGSSASRFHRSSACSDRLIGSTELASGRHALATLT